MRTAGSLDAGQRGRATAARDRRAWMIVTAAVIAIAVVSLASNRVGPEELEGARPVASFMRKTLSKFVNSGTLWAGLAVLAGWWAHRPLSAAVGGVLAAEGALALHYALGRTAGMYGPGIWRDNLNWFVIAAMLCAPLGVVGMVAQRRSSLGLAARLVVPAGALAEPWATGLFGGTAPVHWPERWSSIACGVLLIIGGAIGALVVLAGYASRSRD